MTMMLAGCTVKSGSTEDTAGVSEAFRVDDPDLACGTPNPDLGEYLGTAPGGGFQEWTDSINALPSGPIKTDLLNRLLTSLEGPQTAYGDITAQTAFLRSVSAP